MTKDRLWRTMAAALLLFAALAPRVTGDEPLTTADLVRFLGAGISERTILAELHERGFSEPLDLARETQLRKAGATETLVVAVRRAAPEATPAPATPTPTAGARRGAKGDPAPAPAEAPRGLTFAATARSVRVPVSVLDKRGEPILGLSGEDFQVSEDGKRQAVTFFSGERKPLRIALALDVSASMTDKMKQVEDALRHFIDLLEPADEILVLTFSAEINVEQSFTSDRDLLERVFSRLQPARGTALYDAAIEAIHQVAPGPAESKAVVLVTDGVDTASRASFSDVSEIARRSEVPIFSIGIGSDTGFLEALRRMGSPGGPGGRGPGGGWPGGGGRGGWPGGGGRGGWPGGGGRPGGGGGGRGGPSQIPLGESEFDARPLMELADETGGRAEILKGLENDHGKVDRLKEAVESIAVTLRHRYLVGYEPPPGKAGWRKIRVEVARPSATVQARKGYYTES